MNSVCNDLRVMIEYKNSKHETVDMHEYTVDDYTSMVRFDLLRIISDVENLVYLLNHNQPKEDWSDDVWQSFCGIKHKLLDKANDIGRLPNTLKKVSGD